MRTRRNWNIDKTDNQLTSNMEAVCSSPPCLARSLFILSSLLMMRICRDDANTLFTRRRFYPNPTTCASSRNRLSMSWNPNFPKISLISSTESCSTSRFKSFTFAPSSSKNSRYIGLPFCHSTETFSPNRTRFSTSCFRSFFNSGCAFKRHPGQEMNFAERTRESSSSDGWNRWDEAEDEENAKHIVGVVEKRSNDDDKRRRKNIIQLKSRSSNMVTIRQNQAEISISAF